MNCEQNGFWLAIPFAVAAGLIVPMVLIWNLVR